MAKENKLIVETIVVSPFMSNSYIVFDTESSEYYIIDPGDNAKKIIKACEKLNGKPLGIINTHAHIDHVGAVAEVKRRFGIEFWLHPADHIWLKNMGKQAMFFGVNSPEEPAVEHNLKDGDELKLGKYTIKVLHTPGHSEGGVCFYIAEANLLFSGDTLFQGSIGRTDFPGGDYEQIISSIKRKLLVLPDSTTVYSGHGEVTTIGEERYANPFLR